MKRPFEKLQKAAKHAEYTVAGFAGHLKANIPENIKVISGTAVLGGTAVCLPIINRLESFWYAYIAGIVFYFSLFVLLYTFFKGIRPYLQSPFKQSSLPRFLGGRPDVLLTYPLFLFASISVLNRIAQSISGLNPLELQQVQSPEVSLSEILLRIVMFPLVVLSEETLNLMLVTLAYKCLKNISRLRLPISIAAAAAVFGMLHCFGWGIGAMLPLAISFVPVIIFTLYTGNVWIAVLAHLYNDIAVSVALLGADCYYRLLAVFVLVPVLWSLTSSRPSTKA